MRYVLVAMSLLLGVSTVTAAQASDGVGASAATVTVQLEKGSAGGKSTEGDAVYLEIYRDRQNIRTLQAVSDANGTAIFRDVLTGSGLFAIPRAKHGEMMFGGQPVALTPGKTEIVAGVQVFDVSYDTSSLTAKTHHIIIRSRGPTLYVTEYIQLVNDSDVAVSSSKRDAGGRPKVLQIDLPKGYDNLKPTGYLEEGELVLTDTGFYDTMAMPPGEYQLQFSYMLDITSNDMEIARNLTFPTADLVVFSQLAEAKLTGFGQQGSEVMGQNGKPMKYYKKTDLARGQEVAFRIEGFNVRGSNLTTWLILTLVFSAVLLLALSKLRTGKG